MANQIYFVSLRLDRTVHALGVGFTRSIHVYARGASADDASRLAGQHYEGKYKLVVEQAYAKLAIQQDERRYAFPDQII